MRVKYLIIWLLTVGMFIVSQAQTLITPVWFQITTEIQGTNMNLPAGTIWRMGNIADNKWSATQTVSGTGPLIISTYYPDMGNLFPDPDPGQAKIIIQVLEISISQNIVVGSTTKTVPALSAVVPPPTITPPVTFPVLLKGVTYQCTNISVTAATGLVTITCN